MTYRVWVWKVIVKGGLLSTGTALPICSHGGLTPEVIRLNFNTFRHTRRNICTSVLTARRFDS